MCFNKKYVQNNHKVKNTLSIYNLLKLPFGSEFDFKIF